MTKTLKEKRMKFEKTKAIFFKTASEKLAKAKTPDDIIDAYNYIREEKIKLIKSQRN